MDDATLQPRPAQQPNPPIWTGAMWNNGFARHPLERTARWADGFHPNGMPAQAYAEAKDIISESAASLGRDPAALEWSCNIYLCMGPTKQAAFQEAERAMVQRYGGDAWDIDPATLILGPVSECVETIEEFAAAGVTHFTINPLCEQPTLVANFEQFAAEVIPHFERR